MANILRLSEASALGLHAMAVLTQRRDERLSGRALAAALGASEHTLAKVMHTLVRGGMADAVRGAQGGFRIARDPADVTLLEIYECIEGPFGDAGCLLGDPACDGAPCVMRSLMERLNAEAREHFRGTTLQELAAAVRLGKRTREDADAEPADA